MAACHQTLLNRGVFHQRSRGTCEARPRCSFDVVPFERKTRGDNGTACRTAWMLTECVLAPRNLSVGCALLEQVLRHPARAHRRSLLQTYCRRRARGVLPANAASWCHSSLIDGATRPDSTGELHKPAVLFQILRDSPQHQSITTSPPLAPASLTGSDEIRRENQ